jgi:hypothetical protein
VSRFTYCYAECRYPECRYAECRRTLYVEFRYAECHFDEYRCSVSYHHPLGSLSY